ncbi:MAG: hypothetical protein IKD80_08800 [Selenomonadaceae bacterium]|nr:hypothetical protein [Selenomonadaceae bacterium]
MEQNFVMTTPVLMVMFNRPHKAAEVFAKVRQVKPPKLFIAVDGPRPDRPGEADKVRQCQAFAQMVDWDCALKTDFAATNMGCRDRIASAITWAFEHVEDLIILEDDCVPDLTFFRFCQELLEKYRDDNRIFTIGGFNPDYLEPFEESYAFAKYFECWGWATWRRAWKIFDITMKAWSTLKQSKYWQNISLAPNYRNHLSNEFQLTYEGKINSWAYRYWVNCLANNALHIVPRVNLVRNTGFEPGGTHTSGPVMYHLYMTEPMEFPLTHPEIMSPLDRLFKPPNLSEEELNRTLSEYDATFKQFMKFEQYHAVLILFKQVLRTNITANFLTSYHLNWIYYVAFSYFRLEDYEHAAAMLEILLTFNPQNIDLMLFQARTLICWGAFDRAAGVVEKMLSLEVDDAHQAEIAELVAALGVR